MVEEELTQEQIALMHEQQVARDIQCVVDAGYSGEATIEDWLNFYENKGGTKVFGRYAEWVRMSSLYAGNIELFIEWFKRYV